MRSQTDVLFARNCGGWIPCSYYDAKDEPVAKQGDDHDQAVDAHHQVVPRCEVILQWLYNFKLHDMSHSQMLGKFEYTLPAKF